jgi:hypothetical protein
MLDGAHHIGHIVVGHVVEFDDPGGSHVVERLLHPGDGDARFDRGTTDAEEVFALHVYHRTLHVVHVFHNVDDLSLHYHDEFRATFATPAVARETRVALSLGAIATQLRAAT